jgi:hypothetical protein
MEGVTDGDWRLVLLLAGSAGSPDGAALHAARSELERLRAALRGKVESSMVVGPFPSAFLADAEGDTGGVQSPDFDAVVEVATPEEPDEDSLTGALSGFSVRTASAVSAERSVAVVGRETVFSSRRAPMKLYYCLRRKPGLALEDFHRDWLVQVGGANRYHPARAGYVQLHSSEKLTERAVEASGMGGGLFDGLAMEWFPRPEDLLVGISWSSSAESAAGAQDPDPGGLMGLLYRCVDMGSAKSFLGADEQALRNAAQSGSQS